MFSHKHSFNSVMDIALMYALLLRTRNVKKRKNFLVHTITSQRLLRGKFYTLYEDLSAYPQMFFKYIILSSATFDKLLVLLGPSITFQDTRKRKSMPPEEMLAMT